MVKRPLRNDAFEADTPKVLELSCSAAETLVPVKSIAGSTPESIPARNVIPTAKASTVASM
jgi:hypothetical protein